MRQLFDPSFSDHKTQRDVVHILHTNALSGMLVSVAAITALAFGFDSPETHQLKTLFWFALVTILISRFLDTLFWIKVLRRRDQDPAPAFIRFFIGVAISALVWALYSVLLFPKMTVFEGATTMVVLSALAGGAATVLGASRGLVWTYCTLLLVPMSFMAMMSPHPEFFLLGLLGIAFWITMLATSGKTNTFFVSTIALKRRNQELAEEMEKERNEVIRINQALVKSNQQLDNINSSLEEQVQLRTEEILRLSKLDPLTALMNRSGFIKELKHRTEEVTANASHFALLFLDLDGFKQVNDSLGHQVGDKVLMEIADRLKRLAASENLSRWGGDEFIVVVPGAGSTDATAIAQRFRERIAETIFVDDNEVNLDATIGISLCPAHGDDPRKLIQQADLTMYHQKRNRHHHVGIFNAHIFDELCREQFLREGLRTAVYKGEMSLQYQPVISSVSGNVWSFEALLRWSFNGELISPATFIPIAERSGAINSIGAWVLKEACKQAASWENKDISVAVNVSVSQLMEDDFIHHLDRALAVSALENHRLHVEVTESVFANDLAKLSQQINAIKARGVAVSIDDFGTGFSSLSQLQRLQVDHIKIDRSFIMNLDSTGEPIIRATLLIAGEFGYKTIAEGVETKKQAETLIAMGVDYLQGFYYARPQPNTQLWHWLEQEK